MKAVLIAHYNEDLNWIKTIDSNLKIFIYSKTNKNHHFYPINKGQEVNLYLKYIIDNYKNLPEKTLFLHAHENSYHQEFVSSFICNNVNWECDDYFSVNRRDYYQEVSDKYSLSGGAYHNWLKTNWNQLYNNYLDFPEKLMFYSCAQFVVSQDLILQYPILFWNNLLQWINLTHLSNVITSRIFEYTWHYIFTKNAIEKKYEINEILKI